MRLRKAALLSTCVWLAGPGMALAQSVDSGNEVTVNPIAGGSGVLLYPGDQYMRVIHPALQPGETARDMGTIQLHMPTRHRVAARKAPAAPREAAAVAPKPQAGQAAATQGGRRRGAQDAAGSQFRVWRSGSTRRCRPQSGPGAAARPAGADPHGQGQSATRQCHHAAGRGGGNAGPVQAQRHPVRAPGGRSRRVRHWVRSNSWRAISMPP